MSITTNEYKSAPRPRVRQPQATTDLLRDRIRTGRYSVGSRLPTQRELTEDLHVHRRIVRAALAQLEKEGLLELRRNSPPEIKAAPPTHRDPSSAHKPASNLVALVIHHGGPDEREGAAEQRIFWGLSQALGRAGYHAVLLDLGGTALLADDEVDALHLQYVMDNNFGGVIFYSYSGDKNRNLIRDVSRQMPFVLIDRMPLGIDADYVGMQNHGAMYDATKYLLGLGHRRIAFSTSTDGISTVQAREQGYIQAIKDAPYDDVQECVITMPLVGRSWLMFDPLFSLPADQRPTAVLCVNDYEAIRVADRLTFLGLTVPGDVSIIGCDNIVDKVAGNVGLTTISQPFVEIGKEAARIFMSRVNDHSGIPQYIEIPAELIVRESTKSLL